jgi:hypothetical protein
MAHAIHAAVDAILGGGVLDGSTDDYQAVIYVIKKECADKNFEETNDYGLPAEITLPVASVLWNRLDSALRKVKDAANIALTTTSKADSTSSFIAKVTARSPRSSGSSSSSSSSSSSETDPATSLAIFLLSAGDVLAELGESTAAQVLCYDPAARLMRGGMASLDDDGTSASSNGFGQSISELRLRLSSSTSSRGPIVLHARSVFGAAMAFSKQVSNVANKVGGAGRPGSSDPQLRYELTLRNLGE